MSTLEHCVRWAASALPEEEQIGAVAELMRLYWSDEERWGNFSWREMLDILRR